MDAETDEALMARYQKGEMRAFSLLVSRHEARLWNFLRRYVGDAATAEDLLQEVFLRVVTGAGQWQPAAKFSTWLYTIARNLCTDQARRAVHRNALSLDGAAPGGRMREDDSGPKLIEKLAGGDQGGEQRAANREMVETLDAALAQLPDEQREVFLMREVMDMPFAEIAEAVGVTLPTVKSRMRYALERLRDAMSEFRDPVAGASPANFAEAKS